MDQDSQTDGKPSPRDDWLAAFSSLEAQVLLASENYSGALLESASALAVIEAIRLLEGAPPSVSTCDAGAQIKDSLECALAAQDPLRMFEVHALALRALDVHGIPHDVPAPNSTGIPLGLRRSSLHPSHTFRANREPQSRWLRVTWWWRELGSGKDSPQASAKEGKFISKSENLTFGLMEGATFIVWALVLFATAVFIGIMGNRFVHERRNPLVQVENVPYPYLGPPVFTFCHPEPGFPALANVQDTCVFDQFGRGTISPCPSRAEALFSVSSISHEPSREEIKNVTRFSPSFFVSRVDMVHRSEREECGNMLSRFDVSLHKEWTHLSGRSPGSAKCQTCLQVHSEVRMASEESTVNIEVVWNRFASTCFEPNSRNTLIFTTIPRMASFLSERVTQFIDAGVLEVGSEISSLNSSTVPFILKEELRVPSMFALTRRNTDDLRRYVEMFCNVYFFSGVIFPGSNQSIVYEYNKAEGQWLEKQGSGPYFRVSSISNRLQASVSGYDLKPPKSKPAMSPAKKLDIELSLTPRNQSIEYSTNHSQCVSLLTPDTRTYLIGREERLHDGETRYIPSSAARVPLTSSFALSGMDWNLYSSYQLVFRFRSLVVDEVVFTQSVRVSQFAADVVTVLELCLGLTLFSLFVQLLLFPSQAVDQCLT